jgi:hypothetical protein
MGKAYQTSSHDAFLGRMISLGISTVGATPISAPSPSTLVFFKLNISGTRGGIQRPSFVDRAVFEI